MQGSKEKGWVANIVREDTAFQETLASVNFGPVTFHYERREDKISLGAARRVDYVTCMSAASSLSRRAPESPSRRSTSTSVIQHKISEEETSPRATRNVSYGTCMSAVSRELSRRALESPSHRRTPTGILKHSIAFIECIKSETEYKESEVAVTLSPANHRGIEESRGAIKFHYERDAVQSYGR